MRNISILGSTGSIGTQALDVIRVNPASFNVVALTCGRNTKLFKEQIEEFKPYLAVTELEKDATELQKEFPNINFSWGPKGLIDAVETDCSTVLNSLMGMRGLAPTYHGINMGKDIALANKETLVAGGQLIMDLVAKRDVKLLPVDSEHSAIFQCLQGNAGKEIRKLLLTASGGPFRGYSKDQLKKVTLSQALKHPKWTMGKKITIDSATMMNKGLEVIEAKWLFNVPLSKIEILVHPQSIVHSAVEFDDTSVIAQMGLPDMKIPISIALGYPDRLKYEKEGLDFFTTGANLTFEKPDRDVFGCIDIAYDASEKGGSYPVVMNSANETLVDLFLKEKILFADIENKLRKLMDKHIPQWDLSLDEIIEIDRETREKIIKEI